MTTSDDQMMNKEGMPQTSAEAYAELSSSHIAEQNMIWQRISHRLKSDLGEAKWRAWIKPLIWLKLKRMS